MGEENYKPITWQYNADESAEQHGEVFVVMWAKPQYRNVDGELRQVGGRVQTPVRICPTQQDAEKWLAANSQRVFIYRVEGWTGTPVETEEMRPLRYPLAAIPYERMWADDSVWLPLILRGLSVSGTITFDERGEELSAVSLNIRRECLAFPAGVL